MLRTIVAVVVSSLYMLLEGAIFLPLTIVLKDANYVYRAGVRVCKLAMWLCGAKIVVEGGENLHPGRPCVYVSNHSSNLDPPAIATILPRVVVMAKKEAFKIPVAGYAFRLASFVPVDRGTERAAASVIAGADRLRNGFSLLAFPEGTRSPTDEMLPFRHGVFLMAIRAHAPIVPITIVGARAMMRKGSSAIHPGTIRFIVHPAVHTDGLREDDRGPLAERVREIVASALPR